MWKIYIICEGAESWQDSAELLLFLPEKKTESALHCNPLYLHSWVCVHHVKRWG